MSKSHSAARYIGWITSALMSLVVPWSLVHAGRAIQERRAADPRGEIEIVNVSGKIEVEGWDRSEIEVSGTAGDNVDRVDVTSAGNRTSIRVVSRSSHNWGSDDEARLVVHVPARSAVTATLVSAAIKVAGVLGDVRATMVSGDVHLTARAARTIEIKTISGDIRLTGGGGEVNITTVSGTAIIELADVSRGRFKSVSGDM